MKGVQKLAIGTANFGLDYGINNANGKLSYIQVAQILDLATKLKINFLDTASAYGNSEQVLGKYLSKAKAKDIRLISKVIVGSQIDLAQELKKSLQNLHKKKLFGYLIHNFQEFKKHPDIFQEFLRLKQQGFAEKVGFSLYFPQDLEFLIKHKIQFDIVQVPYNIFDQRFEPYFKKLKENKVEIHCRSVFLQGLFFKSTKELKPPLNKAATKLEFLQKITIQQKIPLQTLCLQFVALNPFIDKIVIGIDSIKQLQENADTFIQQKNVKYIYKELKKLKVEDENIILPFNWKK
ncbi:aldo/keto reductase [Candidatus Beckwithbacteria bacterium]|nr:aldo/keto reductase [Candidatus Beckwithbacteria bacterium]